MKVAEEGPPRHPDPFEDLVDGGLLEPLLEEEVERRARDLVTDRQWHATDVVAGRVRGRRLMELGWVHRVRAADGRTWLVMLTRKGREAFQLPFQECVNS